MNLTSRKIIKNLLKKYQTRLLKRLGQSFLVNREILKKIIKTANPQSNDIILEIGPGIGVLTQELAKKVKKVIAIEKDPKMIEILKETLRDFKNIKIIQGDILKIKNGSIMKWLDGYKVVANLPYYIVSPVIRKFLESEYQSEEMVLMVQKEVAQRIVARPPKMNLLAVSVQFYSKPEIITFVSKKSFWPSPKVGGAIIKIIPRKSALLSAPISDQFFRIIKAGFSQPRKQVANNLSKGLKLNKEEVKSWLLKNKILPSQRAETLTIENWIKLTKSYKMS